MAPRGLQISLTSILAAVLCLQASTSPIGPPPPDICTSQQINLLPCANYIIGSDYNPSSLCCLQLSSVVTTEPQCLCELLNIAVLYMGLNVNRNRALNLTEACYIQNSPINQCTFLSAPPPPSYYWSPFGPPPPPPPPLGYFPNSPPGGGIFPPPGFSLSSGSLNKAPLLLLLFLLFTAVCSLVSLIAL